MSLLLTDIDNTDCFESYTEFYVLGDDDCTDEAPFLPSVPESTEKSLCRSKRVENRDRLLGFIQLHKFQFNELAENCDSAADLRISLFTVFAAQSVHNRAFRILLHYPNELWSFLKSERYNGDPIELASAMACLPDGLSPRTSLDYFLARKNINNFRAANFAAIQEREFRILTSKKRQGRNRMGRWVGSFDDKEHKPRSRFN
jgi:hypothetical protein